MYGATTELPSAVIDAIARVAAGELGRVARLVPPSAAAVLGRAAQPEPVPVPGRGGRGGPQGTPASRLAAPGSGPQNGSAASVALAEVPAMVAERLLGALEVPVAELDLPVPELVSALPEAPARSGPRYASFVQIGTQSETVVELSKLDVFVPGGSDMVAYVAAALAAHPSVAPLLDADTDPDTDEAGIAAAHGARYLALAVLAAGIVLRPLWPAVTPAAVIGTALGVAVPILRTAPMPAGYGEALVAKRRAEYLLPRHSNLHAAVTDHVFALTEGPLDSAVDFSENGLLAVVPNGIAIRSGQESGSVSVMLSVLQEPPADPSAPDLTAWDEIVEVSWHAPAGGASFGGDSAQIAPPWPGDYRVRVSVRDRDKGLERFQVVMWSAPAAEPVVHKHSDRLGHLLRGEPLPPEVIPPDEVYHWVERGSLELGATVTFVPGQSGLQVLRAFGADEAAPTPFAEFWEREQGNIDPWVCVLDVPGGAVAVEYNGWQGNLAPVLRALSSPDRRVAGMYWNINAVRRLALARDGEVLTNFELGMEETSSPEALELLADLDVKGRHRNAVGLLAASRFTGISLSREDLSRIEAVDIGYPILPLLPDLRRQERLPDGSRRWLAPVPLGPDTERLTALPDDELRDLAWWAASFTAAYAADGALAGHPAVRASLAARALTPDAELLARRSQLFEHAEHHWFWMTLHAATNPDALGAAVDTLYTACHALAGRAAELLEQARARVVR